MFVGYQNFAGSWGRNFVGNWFVALQCKTIHYFFKRSWVRVTHKIHEHQSSKNNNDSIVFIYRICNVPRRTFKGEVNPTQRRSIDEYKGRLYTQQSYRDSIISNDGPPNLTTGRDIYRTRHVVTQDLRLHGPIRETAPYIRRLRQPRY